MPTPVVCRVSFVQLKEIVVRGAYFQRTRYSPDDNESGDVGSQYRRYLQHREDHKTVDVDLPSSKSLGERHNHQRAEPEHDDKTSRRRHYTLLVRLEVLCHLIDAWCEHRTRERTEYGHERNDCNVDQLFPTVPRSRVLFVTFEKFDLLSVLLGVIVSAYLLM